MTHDQNTDDTADPTTIGGGATSEMREIYRYMGLRIGDPVPGDEEWIVVDIIDYDGGEEA